MASLAKYWTNLFFASERHFGGRQRGRKIFDDECVVPNLHEGSWQCSRQYQQCEHAGHRTSGQNVISRSHRERHVTTLLIEICLVLVITLIFGFNDSFKWSVEQMYYAYHDGHLSSAIWLCTSLHGGRGGRGNANLALSWIWKNSVPRSRERASALNTCGASLIEEEGGVVFWLAILREVWSLVPHWRAFILLSLGSWFPWCACFPSKLLLDSSK